jgi:hypothetical protein
MKQHIVRGDPYIGLLTAKLVLVAAVFATLTIELASLILVPATAFGD